MTAGGRARRSACGRALAGSGGSRAASSRAGRYPREHVVIGPQHLAQVHAHRRIEDGAAEHRGPVTGDEQRRQRQYQVVDQALGEEFAQQRRAALGDDEPGPVLGAQMEQAGARAERSRARAE